MTDHQTQVSEDAEFIAEVRKAQESLLDEWSSEVEADASVADVLRLCDLAEKGLNRGD